MNTPQDGGPAFPHVNPGYDGNWDKERQIGGMSLRDWFAGQALAGAELNMPPPLTAADCYALADAMLEARKAKP
jgi:hypothetical protein